jgi:hypothetical protein
MSFVAETANTSVSLAYQWRRSSDGGTIYADIAGATGKRYILTSVNLADDGAVFMVQVRQEGGGLLQATSRLAVSVRPGIVFTDGDFRAADWQASPAIVAGYPAFTHVEERVSTEGNPAPLAR